MINLVYATLFIIRHIFQINAPNIISFSIPSKWQISILYKYWIPCVQNCFKWIRNWITSYRTVKIVMVNRKKISQTLRKFRIYIFLQLFNILVSNNSRNKLSCLPFLFRIRIVTPHSSVGFIQWTQDRNSISYLLKLLIIPFKEIPHELTDLHICHSKKPPTL